MYGFFKQRHNAFGHVMFAGKIGLAREGQIRKFLVILILLRSGYETFLFEIAACWSSFSPIFFCYFVGHLHVAA